MGVRDMLIFYFQLKKHYPHPLVSHGRIGKVPSEDQSSVCFVVTPAPAVLEQLAHRTECKDAGTNVSLNQPSLQVTGMCSPIWERNSLVLRVEDSSFLNSLVQSS